MHCQPDSIFFICHCECRCFNRIDFNRCERCQLLLLKQQNDLLRYAVQFLTHRFFSSENEDRWCRNAVKIKLWSSNCRTHTSLVFFLLFFWLSDISSDRWHRRKNEEKKNPFKSIFPRNCCIHAIYLHIHVCSFVFLFEWMANVMHNTINNGIGTCRQRSAHYNQPT